MSARPCLRWALVLYIVAQFHGGDAAGQSDANLTYGSYLALVYAGAIFGGYIADKVIGYQRSILVGAVFMSAGLFAISYPDPVVFKLGLATIIVVESVEVRTDGPMLVVSVVYRVIAHGEQRFLDETVVIP